MKTRGSERPGPRGPPPWITVPLFLTSLFPDRVDKNPTLSCSSCGFITRVSTQNSSRSTVEKIGLHRQGGLSSPPATGAIGKIHLKHVFQALSLGNEAIVEKKRGLESQVDSRVQKCGFISLLREPDEIRKKAKQPEATSFISRS